MRELHFWILATWLLLIQTIVVVSAPLPELPADCGLELSSCGELLTVSSSHYQCQVDLRNLAISSFQDSDGHELLSAQGLSFQYDYSVSRKVFRQQTGCLKGPAEFSWEKGRLAVSGVVIVGSMKIREQLCFPAGKEHVTVTYTLLETSEPEKPAVIHMPLIDPDPAINKVIYPISENDFRSKIHDRKTPGSNFEIHTIGRCYGAVDPTGRGLLVAWKETEGTWWPPVFAIRWVYGSTPMLRFVTTGKPSEKIGLARTVVIAPRKRAYELKIQLRNLLDQAGLKPIDTSRLVTFQGSERLYRDSSSGLIWAEGTEKIRLPEKRRPVAERSIVLYGARNEQEEFQVELSGRGRVAVRIQEGEGLVPLDWIRVHRVVSPIVRQSDDIHVNNVSYPMSWPDALIPLSQQHRLPGLLQEAGALVWISVKIPSDAEAGRYQGRLVIEQENVCRTVLFELYVWNFSLPVASHYDFWLGFSKAKAQTFRGNIPLPQVMKEFIDRAADQKMTVNVGEMAVLGGQELLTYAASRSAVTMIPVHLWLGQWGNFRKVNGHAFNTSGYWEEIRKVLNRQRNYLQMHHVQLPPVSLCYDEPSGDDLKQQGILYGKLHEIWPELKIINTDSYHSQLNGKVDIWCVPSYEVKHSHVEAAAKAGAKTWFYTCLSERYPYPTLRMDRPGMVHRSLGGLMWKYGLNGYLYWGVNEWVHPVKQRETLYLNAGEHAGDGYLFYPGLDGSPANESIRLYQLRDGLEDAELFLLNDALAAKGNFKAKQYQRVLRKMYSTMKDYPMDSVDFLELRRKIGENLHHYQER